MLYGTMFLILSASWMKYQDQGNLQKEFIWADSSREVTVHQGSMASKQEAGMEAGIES